MRGAGGLALPHLGMLAEMYGREGQDEGTAGASRGALAFELLKEHDAIVYLVGGQAIHQSQHTTEQLTKLTPTELFRENNASMLTSGGVPCTGQRDEVLGIVGQDGHALFCSVGQLGLVRHFGIADLCCA